ncbi:zinc finger protein Xfin-like isoform X1 [Contarinia nasturtii]|uniref:zinc finger protein Xfin-like isoform X1 n=1 Tax=Contarinia nasturtii TaxID=265458 RepID=UPI0012D483DB|nr:zinc finger protein Xfin-like isoform X1 [Contarinia nasturtii]
MPNLNSLTEPIKTAYEFVPNTQRYRCPIYACSIGWKTFDKFKAHLNHDHREANGFTCLHCKEFFGRNIDHASVHGNIVTECGDCKNVFSRDFDVLLHQLSRHDDDDGIHMYRRNFRYSSNVISLQEICVIFECALCKKRFDSQTQAVQHYIKGHSSRHISLTLIRLMKEVNYDSTISYSLIQGGSSFALQQHFVCGHCKQVLYTKDAMTSHHTHHRYQQLAINFTRIHLIDTTVTDNFWVPKVSFDQYLFYYCEHCEPDFKNSKVYGHVDDVYDHWRSTHGNGSKSFRFLVAQLAQCYYCKFISTFQGLQKHQNIHHRQCSFAILHLIDPLKCGLCASTIEPGKDFVKHFQTAHELVLKSNVFNPIAMDNGALKELIKIKGNQKHKCTRCNKIFDTKTAFLDHVNRHSTHNQSDQFYDNESVHMMAGCCDTVMKPFDFSHFKEHYYRSKRHQKQDRGVKKERDAIMMDYFQTKVVFGNGMVLNKHCLLGTDLDDRQDFENYIDQLIQTYE